MNKSETVKMIMHQIKPNNQISKLVNCIVENTIDILEEKGMIDYSKCTEDEKETESKIDTEKIARLIECGCSSEVINKILAKNNA